MRVISGKYRSLTLCEFKGRDIRPTADRVKESLFNILSEAVRGVRALDLFCGSGALGIECLSRGAKFVHFNDISQESLSVLKKNLKKLKDEQNYKVTNLPFEECLYGQKQAYGLIFIDPPYKSAYGKAAMEIISSRGLLEGGGVLVFESDKPFSDSCAGLQKYDERKYGKTYLTFFKTV